MLIGKLASISGLSRDTIRYYEKFGLIQASNINRLSNNYKSYQPQILQRLEQVSQLKDLGFTLMEIKNLLDEFETSSPCQLLPKKLKTKIALIDQRIKLLELYKNSLLDIHHSCDGDCNNSKGMPDCFKSH